MSGKSKRSFNVEIEQNRKKPHPSCTVSEGENLEINMKEFVIHTGDYR